MIDTGDVRKQVKRVIERSRQAARARRALVDEASRDGERVLRHIVAPVVRTVAAVLTSEDYPFQVATPAGAVRLQAQASADSFIQLDLDVEREPPALRVCVSQVRGRRVLVEEDVICSADDFESLTEDDILKTLLAKLGPFVAK